MHAAHLFGPRFADGASYVSLAAVRDAADVVSAVIAALKVPSPPGGADPEGLLASWFRARSALLVLDNFEQVLGAAAAVARLLAVCRHLKVLVTSREALRVQCEAVVPVPPLSHDPGASAERPSAAMLLFEQRARAVRPDFALSPANRGAVSEICTRLDALPLAIELAASRVRVLTPEAIVARLTRTLPLLTDTRRDAPDRHRTLRAALDWSHDLLGHDERVFFRRLGAFTGSFSEQAAAAVVGDSPLDVLDGLAALVDKSLVVTTEVAGQSRYHLLETVREYALECLEASGEAGAARLRLVDWVTDLLASMHDDLGRAGRERVFERLELEDSPIRAALRVAASPDLEPDRRWRFFVHFAWARAQEMRMGEIWAAFSLFGPLGPPEDPFLVALADGVTGWLSCMRPDARTVATLERVCASLEAAGDRAYLPNFTTALGTALGFVDPARALGVLHRAIALGSPAGQSNTWPQSMIFLTHLQLGDLEAAEQAAHALVDASRRQRDDEGMAFGMSARGRIQVARGDLPGARASFADAAAHARTRRGAFGKAEALSCLAGVNLAVGDLDAGRAVLEELIAFMERGSGVFTVELAFGALAALLAREGATERARVLLGAIPPAIEDDVTIGMQRDPTGAMRALTREARQVLGPVAADDPSAVDVRRVVDAALGR